MKYLAIVSLSALFVFGCKEEVPADSPELLSVNVYAVQFQNPQQDPYAQVAFIRVAMSDKQGLLTDKFVHFVPGQVPGLEDIPFGDDLTLTIEGWSQSPSGTIDNLVSRGRSHAFTVSVDTDPQAVNVMLSRVNDFALTTMRDPNTGAKQPSSMTQGRTGHTVTLLPDGQVIITGGAVLSTDNSFTDTAQLQQIHASVELYNANTHTFTSLAVGLSQPRAFHTATPLADGRILIAGGFTGSPGNFEAAATIELIDPFTGSIAQLPINLNTSRAAHTASALDDSGHVMLAGGFTTVGGQATALGSVEVICVADAPCAALTAPGVIYTTNMAEPRAFHTATRVAVGQSGVDAILLMGGEGDDAVRSSVETFVLDPAGMEAGIAEMVAGARTRHTATYVDSQKFIHVAGGFTDLTHTTAQQQIDSYQVQQRQFQNVQPFFALHARGGHDAVLMGGNAVLIFGGYADGAPLNSAEVVFEYFDEQSGQTFIDRGGVPAMHGSRGGGRGIMLKNGSVLLVGGAAGAGQMNTMGEFFNPL